MIEKVELPFIDDPKVLQVEFLKLYKERIEKKLPTLRVKLKVSERKEIFQKTKGVCHVCGKNLSLNSFQADHITPFVTGGEDKIENFLPACLTCNNYRWFYLPDEIQWILKLGIWARTQVEFNTPVGEAIANEFASHESYRESRRKNPRKPFVHSSD